MSDKIPGRNLYKTFNTSGWVRNFFPPGRLNKTEPYTVRGFPLLRLSRIFCPVLVNLPILGLADFYSNCYIFLSTIPSYFPKLELLCSSWQENNTLLWRKHVSFNCFWKILCPPLYPINFGNFPGKPRKSTYSCFPRKIPKSGKGNIPLKVKKYTRQTKFPSGP